MAEINRSDIWGDDLLSAPLVYAGNVEKAVDTTKKLLETTKQIEKSVQAATTISKIAEETQKLGKAQSDLDKAQTQITANSRQRSAQELKSLDELVKKRESLRSSIKSLQKDEKEDLQLLKQKIITREEYRKRVDANNVSIAKYKVQVGELNRTVKESIITTRTSGNEYQKLTIALENARKKYKDLAASGTASNNVLKEQASVVSGLNAKVNTIDNAVGQFQRNVGNYSKTFGIATSSIKKFISAFGITSGIYLFANALKDAIKLNTEFEKQMSAVKAISGATDKEFKTLRKSAVEIGGAFEGGALGVANMQLELSRLGFTTKEIIDSQEAILLLSQATGSDLTQAADLAGSTIRAFQKDAKETTRVAEIMAAGFNTTALSIDNYSEAIKYVAPIANAANISLEETTALLGVLANSGIRGSQAGTALRRIINELAKDGRPLVERLLELSKGGITLADAQDQVGRYAQTALIVLGNQVDKVEELTATYEASNGVLQETAGIMTNNVAGSITKVSNAWDAWMLRVADSKGYLKRLIDDTRIIIDLMSNETAKQISSERGFWARLFPNIDQLLNLEEYKKRLEEIKSAQNAFDKITTEGFVKPFKTWEELQDEQLKKLVNANAKKELTSEEEEKRLNKLIAGTVRYNEAIIRTKELELSIQKEIYGDENNSLADRLAALKQSEIIKGEIITAETNKRIAQARRVKDTLIEIESERSIAEKKNIIDSAKARRDIIKQERFADIALDEEVFKKQIDASIKFLQTQFDEEKNIVKKQYADGLIGREQYNKAINDIDQKYSEWNVDGQIFYLESQLLPAVKKYTQDRLDLVKGNKDEEDKINREGSEVEKGVLNEIAVLRQKLLDVRVDNTDKAHEKEIAQLDLIQQIYEQFAQSITAIFSGITARRIQNIDEEIKASDEQTKKEVGLAGDNDKAKERIEKAGEARRQELEKKKRAEQRKAAALEKSAAIISSLINTSIAVTKALAQGGFILGVPFAAVVGALGALQIAAIASQPLPAFEKGGVTQTPTFVAGEKGTEMYVTPHGELGFTPNKATVMQKPVGTEIFTHDKTMQFLAMGGMRTDSTPDYALYNRIESLENTISKGNKELVKAVIESAPGDSFMQGSLAYEAKRRADGSKKIIRRKTMGY